MTMNFVVFESGSRAGLSAELFFEHYVDATGAKHQNTAFLASSHITTKSST